MRPICSIKRVLRVLAACVIVLGMAGCPKKEKEAEILRLKEWMMNVQQEAGLEGGDAMTAAEAWNILPPGSQEDDIVDRETAAYVLAHLYGDMKGAEAEYAEKDTCRYPEEIMFVLQQGWMRTDRAKQFHPEQHVTKEEAGEMLSQTVWAMNHRELQNHTEISWKDKEPEDLGDLNVDLESMTVQCPDDAEIQQDDLVQISGRLFRIQSKEEDGTLHLKEAEINEEVQEADLSGTFEADLSEAVIETEGTETTNSAAGLADPLLLPYTRTMDIKGFRVWISATSAGIHAEASRILEHGGKVSASLSVNGIRCSYAWKKGNTEGIYLRIQCSTVEKAGMRYGISQNRYADFAKVDRQDPIGSLQKMFVEKRDVLEASLPICTVTLPLPQAPAAALKLAMELHMYASGRIELTLRQDHVLGFEVRDKKLRLIRETEKKAEASFRAAASLTAGIRFALTLFQQELMDAFLEAGAKASCVSTVHQYDDSGHLHSTAAQIDPDLAEEYSLTDPKFLVCMDLTAGWLMNLRVNSSKTAAGKLGLSRSFNILDPEKSPLFSDLKFHMEHFLPTAACTVKEETLGRKMDELQVNDTITLASYSIHTEKGKKTKITVSGLPEGYAMQDVRYESLSECAEAEADGMVKGVMKGAGIIKVHTSDDKYSVLCHVMVTE